MNIDIGDVGKRPEGYALIRHQRPSQNYKLMLASVEGFQDGEASVNSGKALDHLRDVASHLKQGRSAFLDLLVIMIALCTMLYLLQKVSIGSEHTLIDVPAESEVFSDELLDLTGIAAPPAPVNFAEIRQLVEERDLGAHVQIILEEGRSSLQLNSRVLFNDGSFDLARSGEPILAQLLPSLLDLNRSILVEVHTHGNEPLYGDISSEKQLSLKRSESISEYLVSKGFASKQITLKGLGATQPLGNESQENSRVSIVFE